jgi:hypothetical protein
MQSICIETENHLKKYAKYEHPSTRLLYNITKNIFLKTVDMNMSLMERTSETTLE